MESYCRRFPTRHILLMNLDEYLFALGAGMEAPADLSGIFFRPSFYYRSDFQEASFRTRAFNSLQKQLIDRLLDHPQLRAAFFIDPWVAESLQATGSAQVLCLKEPVRLPGNVPTLADKAEIKRRLGLPADRKVFLLAGEISGRKGVWRVLEALDRLAPEEASRVCVAIVGHAEAAFEERLTQQLAARTASARVTVIRRAGYLDEAELGDWFAAADVVLAPYIGFAGMSGILLLAAAHRKPVISADSGAIARITREYRLGVTVDPRSPAELARAIARFLGDSRPGWDEELAYSFAQDRSADKFGKRLLDALGPYLR
jgi:glycosyltransferase involved in cell wall biosynthesis